MGSKRPQFCTLQSTCALPLTFHLKSLGQQLSHSLHNINMVEQTEFPNQFLRVNVIQMPLDLYHTNDKLKIQLQDYSYNLQIKEKRNPLAHLPQLLEQRTDATLCLLRSHLNDNFLENQLNISHTGKDIFLKLLDLIF